MAPPSDDEYCPNFVFEPPSGEEYSDTGEHKDSGPLQQRKLAVAISNSGSELPEPDKQASLESQKRHGNEGSRKIQEEKIGTPLVDLAYSQAKAVKAENKARDASKMVKKASKTSHRPPHRTQSRTDEMREMFQSDISQKRHNGRAGGAGNKKPKHSFKSKSRYKRR